MNFSTNAAPDQQPATPLALIGGSQFPAIEGTELYSSAFFDWYQASIETDPKIVADKLHRAFGVVSRPSKPQPPYLEAVEFVPPEYLESRDVIPLCNLHFGGINDKCMVRSSGMNAEDISDFIRKEWPDHSVSRCDAALDFDNGPDFFSNMASWLIHQARERQLKTSFAGDWANGTQGRTLYIGSRQSAIFIRFYEKGLEQMAKHNLDCSVDWVRFEVEAKPAHRSGKQAMATQSPGAVFGSSRLLRDMASELGADVEPLKIGTVRARTDYERTFSHLAYQYGAFLQELVSSHQGDLESAMLALMERVEYEKVTRRASRDRTSAAQWHRLIPTDPE